MIPLNDHRWKALEGGYRALVAIVKGNMDLGELIFEIDEGCERNLLRHLFES
jgi:hypothetical protein